ncbi:MAG TPA: uroporphyrinogen decarboxylase family protein, partial [Spirochaetota bacterium]|nr:uroporphyrinogen decarboxylase family protein [Spirochaetota bacterium]
YENPRALRHRLRAAGGKIKFRVKGTPDVQEILLKKATDTERVNLDEVKHDEGIQTLAGAAKILSGKIGSHTVVGTSQWAPFTLGGLAFGVEGIMRGIYRDKASVHAVLEFATELCWRYLEPFIDSGVSMISLADPSASGDMISREQFVEFSLPYLSKVARRIKHRGVNVTVHICGDTTNRLDTIPSCEADVMSMDYKVDLAEAARILGGKIAFAGNMNPVAVMQKETPEGVRNACLECIGKTRAIPGYILMPGCDIPPSVPVENVKAMVDAARDFRID